MAHAATGIDDIRNVALALGRLRMYQRFTRAPEHFRWIVLVQQDRTDRISAHWPHAVGLCADGRPAIWRVVSGRDAKEGKYLGFDNWRMVMEQLAALKVDLEWLASALEKAPRAPELQRTVQRVEGEIAQLGAVNLAALEELAQASERKPLFYSKDHFLLFSPRPSAECPAQMTS